MEVGSLKDYLGAAALVISLAGVVYAWITARSKINEIHLKELEEKVAAHNVKILRMENELKHLPAKDDVNDLKLAIVKLEGTVGKLEESLSSVARTTHRIDDFLRKEGKG